MPVQVECKGDDQRAGGFIHALDMGDRLLQLGFDLAAFGIRTAQQNGTSAPINQDLLSETNSIRIIITKQALQEGWDCPFAYVWCALATSTNLSVMTQLLGRILRLPWTKPSDFPTVHRAKPSVQF